MKYEKLMANIFAQNTKNNSQAGFALVAGLAIGAVLGVLFTPKSGSDVRKGFGNKAKDVGGSAKDLYTSLRNKLTGEYETIEDNITEEQNSPRPAVKKPKSDIKELIHEAHVNGVQTEQSLN